MTRIIHDLTGPRATGILEAMPDRWPVLLMARELGLGGSERQLCEVAKALDRSRFEPHAGAFRAAGLRADELRVAGVPLLELGVGSFLKPSAAAGALRMGRYLRRHSIRLVHTFDVPLNEFGVAVARAFGVPVVLSSQRAHRELVSSFQRHCLRLTDAVVDGIVVNSKAVRRQLIEEDRVPPAKIHLCYNGIDTARFHPGRRCRPAELHDASVVVGVLCAIRPEKGLATLVEAFAKARAVRPGAKLLIVGSGPSLDGIKALAAGLGLGRDCRFEPATAEAPKWLRAIDIFVLPSLSEALSNSLMEAMACGCCPVASSTGGNPELVEHDRTGLLFHPGDAEELAALLRLLLAADALRRQLADAASRAILDGFSLHASVRRMEQIYAAHLGPR